MSNLFYEKELDTFGLYVEEAKNTHCLQHFHNSLEMVYIEQGSFHAIIDGNSYHPVAHEILFVPPLSSHIICDADSVSITLTIPPNWLSMYTQSINNQTFPTILSDTEYNKQVILPLFKALLNGHSNTNPFHCYSLVYSLFATIFDCYPLIKKPLEKEGRLILDIINYLNENFKQPITLDSLAKRFHYSKFHFSKLFDKYFHCTLKYYLNTLRVNYVAENLHTSQLSLTELIYEAGFNSSSTFYRYYKLIFSSSPKKTNFKRSKSENP